MAVTEELFGKGPKKQDIMLYTLSNSRGMQVSITNVGATIVKMLVPDADGKVSDVVLGFDAARDYCKKTSVTGMVVGPHANRIAGASYELDGVRYRLQRNDKRNNLHSHRKKGYQRRIWEAAVGENCVTFSLEDADGNMGFPGNKKVSVTYSLDENNGLTLHYHGSSDKNTVLNLTNHVYFNLDGHDAGSIEGHELWMGASHYTPVGKGIIPTGEIASVKGTPMDFTEQKRIGQDINADWEQLRITGGYDHNFVIDDWDESLRHFATLKGDKSSRALKVYTTLPGVQLYTGNFIVLMKGKAGAYYDWRQGVCLETQYFPDSVHHENFPACIFGGDKEYDSVTVFRFE